MVSHKLHDFELCCGVERQVSLNFSEGDLNTMKHAYETKFDLVHLAPLYSNTSCSKVSNAAFIYTGPSDYAYSHLFSHSLSYILRMSPTEL